VRSRRWLAWLVVLVPAPLLAAERFEIRLGEQLGLGDLRLAGPRATSQVEFPWPLDWRALPGAELRLRFDHSPAIDGERSFLAVSLNHGVLRSFRLEARNAQRSELVVAFPPEMLREENALVISAEQFTTGGAAEEAWTRVRSDTSLSIPFERQRVEWSLGDLPAPLLRRGNFEAARLAILLPSAPSRETLEATARCIASLASGVAPAPVALIFPRSLREISTPALVVGTPREQAALAGELGSAGEEAAARAGPTTGVVVLLPEVGPRAQPVLVVTGKEPAAVRNAALGLLLSPKGKGRRLLLVPETPTVRPPAPRQWRRFIPPSTGFSIAEAGDPRAELAVTANLPGRVRLDAPPDARFLPYGHRATLVFETLPAAATDAKAELDVYWNDVLLRQASMEQKARGRGFTLSAPIPATSLRSENVLTVAWNGRSGAGGPFVALRGESTLVLPRDYVAALPDLALLRSGFYPFSLRADLSDTVVGLPKAEEAIPALCELAAVLGRRVPSERFLFRVAPLSEALASRGRHAILLEVGDESALALPDVKRLPRGDSLLRLPLVQELESPRGDGRFLLRLQAATPALLRAAARGLGEPSVLERLRGDVAFLASEGPQSFRLGTPRRIAEISYLTHLQAWMRAYWIALPLILTATSSLLFMGLRFVLAHYRSGRP
jgi:hypothetical protein